MAPSFALDGSALIVLIIVSAVLAVFAGLCLIAYARGLISPPSAPNDRPGLGEFTTNPPS